MSCVTLCRLCSPALVCQMISPRSSRYAGCVPTLLHSLPLPECADRCCDVACCSFSTSAIPPTSPCDVWHIRQFHWDVLLRRSSPTRSAAPMPVDTVSPWVSWCPANVENAHNRPSSVWFCLFNSKHNRRRSILLPKCLL